MASLVQRLARLATTMTPWFSFGHHQMLKWLTNKKKRATVMIPQNSLGWLIDPTGKWTRRNGEFTMTGLFAFRHRTGWAVGLVKCRTPKLLVFVWNRWSAAEWSRWERHLLNLGHVFIGQMVSQDDSIWLVVWNIFFHILGPSQLTNNIIQRFSERLKPPTRYDSQNPRFWE